MTAPRHERARAALADPAVQAALQAQPVPLPDDALNWLGRLCRLEGMPFEALVPVAAMLPPESVRFFYVDQNWLDALVDGALSIADLGGDEQALLRTLQPGVRAGARVAVAAGAPGPPASLWSGVLLRSTVVADYPGLIVRAYPDAEGTSAPLGVLRSEPVSATVRIAIFDGVAQRVEIAKPSEILHFGVEPAGELGPPWKVPLRGTGAGSVPLGQEIAGQSAALALRDDSAGRQVVDVTTTVANLEGQLAAALGTSVALGPATLGIQLVQSAERAVFSNETGA